MTAILDASAKEKALPVRAFVATHPDGMKEYVLVEGGAAIYAAQSFEFVAARLDIMSFARDLK